MTSYSFIKNSNFKLCLQCCYITYVHTQQESLGVVVCCVPSRKCCYILTLQGLSVATLCTKHNHAIMYQAGRLHYDIHTEQEASVILCIVERLQCCVAIRKAASPITGLCLIFFVTYNVRNCIHFMYLHNVHYTSPAYTAGCYYSKV